MNTLSLGLAIAAAMLSSACNQLLGVEDLTQSDADAAVEVDAPPGTVSIRFVNVVRDFPTSGAVDVYVGDETTARVTALRDVSDYVVVDPRVTTISLRQQGQSGGAPLHEFTNLAFVGDTKVTAVIAGVNASQAPDDRVRLLPLVEEFAQAGTGQAQVRFVNAITDAPEVGIDVGLNSPAAPEVVGLARFDATPAAGLQATAGQTMRVGLLDGGTTFAAFAANGLELGKGCFVIFSGQRQAPFGSVGTMKSATVCASRTPTMGSLGSELAIAHVVADGTTCDVRRPIDGQTLISSIGPRQFGTTWLMAEDESSGASLDCGGQSVSIDVSSDTASEAHQQVLLLGGALSPSVHLAQRFYGIAVPASGPRHAYLLNLSADVGDVQVRLDGMAVGEVLGTVILGPHYGQADMVLPTGNHTLAVEDAISAVTVSFTVSGGTGGATVYVLEGARVPQGTQRPLRLTPLDISVFPPSAGIPIAPN